MPWGFFLAAALCVIIPLSSCSKKDDKPDTSMSNIVLLDGYDRPIERVWLDKSDLEEGKYDIVIFLPGEYGSNGIKIQADSLNHNNKVIDLSVKEKKHDGWYISIEYLAEKTWLFDTYYEPGSTYYEIFLTGTLRVKVSKEKKQISIELKNGIVKDNKNGDGKRHEISISYNGPFYLDEF